MYAGVLFYLRTVRSSSNTVQYIPALSQETITNRAQADFLVLLRAREISLSSFILPFFPRSPSRRFPWSCTMLDALGLGHP